MTRWHPIVVALALLIVEAARAADDPVITEAKADANGVLVHAVRSPYQSGTTAIRVLLPDKLDAAKAYAVVYVLPVEARDESRYGDGLLEAKKLDLPNTLQTVFVAPTFSHLPWYADHPTDRTIRQESYLLKVVLPFVEKQYPVRADPGGRLLVGFSKSGWGAFSLLLRHPDVFGRAAAWDAPVMMNAPGRYGSGDIFGTRENFEQYQITKLLEQHAADLSNGKRLVLLGYGNFREHHRQAHVLMERLKIDHEYRDGPERKHEWASGWLSEAITLLSPPQPRPHVARPVPLLRGEGQWESAPHGSGNVYAPDVLFEDGTYRMWYGGQGKDGHDRILHAVSKDGTHWDRSGIAVEDPTANHVNDPSVVKVNGTYFMYFTRATKGVVDEVAVATSDDGLKWTKRGTVLSPGKAGEWDGLSVGRPSVIFEDGLFKLWFDGRKDLPLAAPAEGVAKSPTSTRSVGYATSKNGLQWTKHEKNPVFGQDAGGIDVKKVGKQYVMLYESHEGTKLAMSRDGIVWSDHGVCLGKSGEALDAAGHVTPSLLAVPGRQDVLLFFGAAAGERWDHNAVAVCRVPLARFKSIAADKR